jgi:hypothetical protein
MSDELASCGVGMTVPVVMVMPPLLDFEPPWQRSRILRLKKPQLHKKKEKHVKATIRRSHHLAALVLTRQSYKQLLDATNSG